MPPLPQKYQMNHSHPDKIHHNPPPDHHTTQNQNNTSKPSLKIKHTSALDISSNLEFTQKGSKYMFSNSLANVNPDGHSFSIRKIPHNTSNPHLSTYKSPKKAQNPLPERVSQEKINGIVKNISDSDQELPLYTIWPGNNTFYLGGRLMTGPKADRIRNLIVCAAFLVLNAVFFAFAVPYLMDELDSLLPLVASYLSFSTTIFFLLTSFTDPGIIPRKCVWELSGEVPLAYCERIYSNEGSVLSQGKLAEQAEDPSRFCNICNIHKPSRTVHCKRCGNCVEVHKGHLSFMSNCIGKRNYKYYIGFIASVVLMGVCYITCFLIMIIQQLTEDGWGFGDETVNAVFGVIVGIPSVILFFISLAFLFAYLRSKSEKKKEIEGRARAQPQPQQDTKPSVNWYYSEPSRINPRKLLTRAQLLKYKAALLGEQQIETEVIIEVNDEEE